VFFAHPNVALRVGYTILSTIEAHGSSSSLQVDRHPTRLGVAALLPLDPVVLGLEVDAVLDHTSFRNFHLAEGYVPVEDDDDLVFWLQPSLLVAVTVLQRLRLFVSMGASVPFNRKRYVTTGSGGQETLLAAWPVQPLLLAGLVVILL